MQFNKAVIKSTLFGLLASLSSAAFADHLDYKPTPTPTPTPVCMPTPICYPTPTPGHNPVSSVPEPSAWIPLVIGAIAIVALAYWNRFQASKANS